MKTNEESSENSDSVPKPLEVTVSNDKNYVDKNDGILPTIGHVINPQGEAKDLEVDDEVLVPLVELPPPPGK
jgi:hypothetical protein